MGKVNRGRFTISANIVMTTSLITRAFTFGFIMMSIYIKAGDDILDSDVISVVNGYEIYGIPYGSAVKGLVFSLAGVFGIDLITGISGLYGILRRRKIMLGVTAVLSTLLLGLYCIYMVLFGLLYADRHGLSSRLNIVNRLYRPFLYMSSAYQYTIYPGYVASLGCITSVDHSCSNIYIDQLKGYIEAYFGMIGACIVCQVLSMIATEYTFRKIELKEKKEKISSSKYYLLCTVKLGIFRSFLIFVKNSWKRSKNRFISVVIKILSLVTGIGLLGLGLTIISHEFIINPRLKSMFFRLQFFEYYLYDIIVGLAASSVTIGIVSITVAIIGLVGSWRRSKNLQLINTVLSFFLQIPRIACFILFVAFLGQINNSLRSQLEIQQTGYYATSPSVNELTMEWNTMIQKLDCCGVNNSTDTFTSDTKTIFCYKNANEIPTYPTEYYGNYNNLDNYIGRGGFRTTTCKSRIYFILKMMIGWFASITLLQVFLEIIGTFFANKEFKIYQEEELHKETNPKPDPDTKTSYNIVVFILKKVKAFIHRTWKSSKVNFVFWSCVSCCAVLHFGLLVLAIQIRYDKVLGNIYIKEYIFNYIDTGDYSLKRLLDYFHIVLSTFSIASLLVVIYIFVTEALHTSRRMLHVILVIIFLTALFVADITLVGLWGKAYNDISGNLTSGLDLHLRNYEYSHNSLTNNHPISAAWNTLFIKAECCGVGTYFPYSMTNTGWYNNRGSPSSRSIPEYCCQSRTNFYPYSTITDTACTTSQVANSYYARGCNDAILSRIKAYSITAFVFLVITFILEILCVIIAIYKVRRLTQEGDTIHTHADAADDKEEIIKLEEPKEENILEDIKEKESRKRDNKKRKKTKKGIQSDKDIQDNQINPGSNKLEKEDFDEEVLDVPHQKESVSSVINVKANDDEKTHTKRDDSITEVKTKDIPDMNESVDDLYSQTFDDNLSASEDKKVIKYSNELVTDLDESDLEYDKQH